MNTILQPPNNSTNLSSEFMEAYNTCVIRVKSTKNYSSNASHAELLSQLDAAMEAREYEVVCLSNRGFSIADIEHEEDFSIFVQFDFPEPILQLEQIEQEIRDQIAGICHIDTLKLTDHYRLLRIEKCDFSFK